MTNDRSCPCRSGVLTVTDTGITPFSPKLKSTTLFLTFALVFGVMLFANPTSVFAQGACQASGSIQIQPSTGGSCGDALTAGQQKDITIQITNSSSTLPLVGSTPVTAKLVGTTIHTLACTNGACAVELPGTLTFVPGPVDGCVSHVAGVASCSANGANKVNITMTAGGVPLPAGAPLVIATFRVQANTFVGSACGVFGERADTGPNDIVITDALCSDPKPSGGGQGSTNEFFPQCVTANDCTPSTNECKTAVCTNNTCGTENKADSTACTDTTTGDCKTAGCEAGVCVQTHANKADSTACTSTPDVAGDCGTPGCEAGVCVANHIPVADSTACSVGVTGTPSECATPGCEAGVCVATHIHKADSTACTDNTPGDCKTAGCESGVCVQAHANKADSTACTSTPDVAGDCGTPGCEAGVCVANHIPVSDSTPCSVGVTGTPNECKTPGCESGVCVAAHINKADSTVCTDTTPQCAFTAGCEAGSCVQEHATESCGQGCTPGFWKANADKKQSNAWPVDPNTKLGTVFTIPPCVASCSQNFGNLTLRQALSLQGGNDLCGKAEILLRISTGSFLNASSSCVQFNLNPAALVAEVNGILASCDGGQFTTESTKLDGFNNQGCPLNQQGQCSNP